ncbi:MAG: enoyl-CoA hydratase-related protein [Nitrospinota bacterium]|jgi:enoyl-CoA hydratase/carnithine racemase|nr:enoyl-CoA hydratase-related protein [Nitrospinota bacterium]
MSEDFIITEKRGGVATVTINRPGQRNAILREMWRRLPEVLEELQADGSLRAAILRGGGERAFASGQDINELRETTTREEAQAHSDLLESVLDRIEKIRIPLIAMVHGYAMGGAVGLLLVCDLRYAAGDAVVGVPAARLGVVYPEPFTRRLVRIVGPARAKEMLMAGRHYSAAEALEMGFFNHVLPKGELEAYVRETAGLIAENAPISVQNAKEIVRLIQDAPLDPEAAQRARALRLEGFSSQDFQEGVRAFLDKRKPTFKGV